MAAPNICVITMGCSKNRTDSEHLMSQAAACGYRILPEHTVMDGSVWRAGRFVDVVAINTCGFIHDAREESVDMILRIVRAKYEGRVGKIYVFGCLSQRYGSELAAEIPEVDAFFGANIPTSSDGTALMRLLGGTAWNPHLDTHRVLTTPPHYAYLKIAEGCDRCCSYCAIPLIRGGHRSVPMPQLLDEAKRLAEGGVRELLVVAQDSSYYGLDLNHKRELGLLLEKLSLLDGIRWIRLHYAYPQAFPLDVLKEMAANPKICNYMDIPLQHVSDTVLTAMRRHTTGAETRALVARFREAVPGICLRTTFMVGHPGEDRKAFEELLAFVKEAKFERMGAFTYSEEEGTWGAAHLRDSVGKRTKEARYARLMETQQGISFAYNQSRVGQEAEILIDRADRRWVYGRTQYESPEVDGQVCVPREAFKGYRASELAGRFAKVSVERADDYDLYARFMEFV